ncbi:MAG: pyrimidine reductase family protein [Canibacter sp.]
MSESIDWWSAYPATNPDTQQSHVRVNFVSSADGAATVDAKSGGLGGDHDRELMAVLRTLSDVVLVGGGTVRAEGYGGLNLPSELLARRQSLGLSPVPRIAVVSGSLNLSPSDPLFVQTESRPIVLTHDSAPSQRREALAEVADVLNCGESVVDLSRALEQLRREGLSRVLCEGGPGLFGDLLEARLVDEVCLTISPVFVAGDATRITQSATAHPSAFHLESVMHDRDGFIFVRYVKNP